MTKNSSVVTYPVLYDFRDLVASNGYVARVEILGRALLEEEADEVSFSGVQPSGLTGSGANRGEAWARYLARHRAVLLDMADEALDFESFKETLGRFFDEPNGDFESLWRDAVAAVRNGDTEVTWARVVSDYPRRRVTVEKVDELEMTRPQMDYLVPAA